MTGLHGVFSRKNIEDEVENFSRTTDARKDGLATGFASAHGFDTPKSDKPSYFEASVVLDIVEA